MMDSQRGAYRRVGYNHRIYPTSSSGIIVLLKTPTKYREFFSTLFCLFVKTTDSQLVFNFEQTRTVIIFGEHGIMAHIPWWLSQSELWSWIALSNDSVFNSRRYRYITFPCDVIDFSYLQGCLFCCDLSFQCPSFIFVFRYFWWRLYEAYIRWKFSGLVAARRLDKMEKRQWWKDCERIYSRARVGIHWQTHPKSDKASL